MRRVGENIVVTIASPLSHARLFIRCFEKSATFRADEDVTAPPRGEQILASHQLYN